MIILKILGIAALVVVILFVLTFTVYFFNLDMKLVGCLYNVLHEFHTRKPVTTEF